jgi:hypothetical protein
MLSLLSNSPFSKVFAAVVASGLLAAAYAAPVLAQATPSDDPYGIGTPSTAPDTTRAVIPVRPDTTRPPTRSVRTDTGSVPAAAAVAPDTAPTPRAARPRITRETTVNPMDVHRGRYRNPKKALFMSLIVPGLGQAYIGQSKFNYIRAALYFTADVTMGYLWYDYSVVKYDKQVKRYRTFADLHWRQSTYEDQITNASAVATQAAFENLNPNRVSYCAAVQGNGSPTETRLYTGCVEPWDRDPNKTTQQDYAAFKETFAGDVPGPGTGARWDDAAADPAFAAGASNPGYEIISDTSTIWRGVSANRNSYNSMRQTAKDYSRMQTWFLGGIVLNHIASAIDAAVTARRHNRVLYEEGGARWYDKINLDGGMAFDQGRPRTHMIAYLSF